MDNSNAIFPDLILLDGQVITMDDSKPRAEAVAVKWDKIVAVGSNQDILNLKGPKTQVINLGQKALLPGFIEPHSHFAMGGFQNLFFADLHSPPLGTIKNIKDLIEVLQEKTIQTSQGDWVYGLGYDDTLLEEQRHPTRDDLDKISKEHPIWIIHISGHFWVANSYALQMAGIKKSTPQPVGGKIRIDSTSGQPDGVFEEKPASALVSRHMPITTLKQRIEGIAYATKKYLQMGITSIYDAGVVFPGGDRSEILAYQKAISDEILPLRVSMMIGVDFFMKSGGDDGPAFLTGFGDSRLKIGPAKILVDGSIQGYTGWLSQPYHVPFRGDKNYRGYPTIRPDRLKSIILRTHREGIQLACHGNGDAAIDTILDAYRMALQKFPQPNARHRIEHCQMVREDQLDQMLELGISPSFFVSHVYYWGDRHKSIFIGPERAKRISPLNSARKRGIKFSIHSDYPVTPVSPLFCVHAAVNRTTQNGDTLGPEYRLTVEEALKAITIDAAWQNFEEKSKGSIEEGKLADFTVITENPTTIDPKTIKDIGIDMVFIGGKRVH